MMWYGGPGWGWDWIWMIGMMVVFWGAIIALAVYLVRSFRPSQGEDAAMATLRRRFAAGEISQQDFEKSKHVLQG